MNRELDQYLTNTDRLWLDWHLELASEPVSDGVVRQEALPAGDHRRVHSSAPGKHLRQRSLFERIAENQARQEREVKDALIRVLERQQTRHDAMIARLRAS